MRLHNLLGVMVVLVCAAPAAANDVSAVHLLQTHIDLDLTIDYDRGTVSGDAVLRLRNVGQQPVASIPIQVGRLMKVTQITDAEGHQIPFTQDVVAYEDWPKFQVGQIYASPAIPLQGGASSEFHISYGGFLVGYTETGMQYVRDRVDRSFTIIRADARAFPIVAEPSIAVLKSQPRSDFTYTAHITVPTGLRVATGVRESETITNDSTVTWVFKATEGIPFLNIAVAPYEVLEKDGVRVYHFPLDSAGARMIMSAIDGATALYEQWFGPLGGAPGLHVIEIPEGWGSQASLTGGIIQTADAFRDANHLIALYHELAHLWDVPDLDRPSPRWNEGLAMFLQQRVAVQLDQAEDLDSYMAAIVESRRKALTKVPALMEVAFIEYGQRQMTDDAYRTGQMMFYVLYRVLGEERFDEVLRGFRQANWQLGCTAAEFATYLQKAADGRAKRVMSDWFLTTEWAHRLVAGETLDAMIADYKR